MKKICLTIFAIMLLSMSTVFAYSDESNADLKTTIDSIKEIRYNVESGVNFRDYSSLVSKASVNLKKYEENYPENDRDMQLDAKYGLVLKSYMSARDVWQSYIYKKKALLDDNQVAVLFMLNPTFKPSHWDNTEYYYYEDVRQGLWSMAAHQEQEK